MRCAATLAYREARQQLKAAPIIRDRIDAYATAKRELVEYGQAIKAALELVATP